MSTAHRQTPRRRRLLDRLTFHFTSQTALYATLGIGDSFHQCMGVAYKSANPPKCGNTIRKEKRDDIPIVLDLVFEYPITSSRFRNLLDELAKLVLCGRNGKQHQSQKDDLVEKWYKTLWDEYLRAHDLEPRLCSPNPGPNELRGPDDWKKYLAEALDEERAYEDTSGDENSEDDDVSENDNEDLPSPDSTTSDFHPEPGSVDPAGSGSSTNTGGHTFEHNTGHTGTASDTGGHTESLHESVQQQLPLVQDESSPPLAPPTSVYDLLEDPLAFDAGPPPSGNSVPIQHRGTTAGGSGEELSAAMVGAAGNQPQHMPDELHFHFDLRGQLEAHTNSTSAVRSRRSSNIHVHFDLNNLSSLEGGAQSGMALPLARQAANMEAPFGVAPTMSHHVANSTLNAHVFRGLNLPWQIPVGFCKRSSLSTEEHLRKFLELISRKASPKSLRPGCIYAYQRPGAEGLLKIGHVEDPEDPAGASGFDQVGERLSKWGHDCGIPVQEVFRVPITLAAERIERLVHRTLGEQRYVQDPPCRLCEQRKADRKSGSGGAHDEWFHVSKEEAQRIVETFKAFSRERPYDPSGKLQSFWRSKADQYKARIRRERGLLSAKDFVASMPAMVAELRLGLLDELPGL